MSSSQPFSRFWNAINDHLECVGLPQIPYKVARELWEKATEDAKAEAYREQISAH